MSATSLKLLLRDPIRFAWRYALGWKRPDAVEEPLTLDALTFGGLVRPDRRHHRLDAEDVERPPQVVGDCLLASAGPFATKAARPKQSSADNYAAAHHFS